MLNDEKQRILSHLEQFVSIGRKERMRDVLGQRTRYILCVLEDLYDPRNGSAVLRHCDAMGLQEVHAIENKNHFRSDEQVDMGSAQWLDMRVSRSESSIPASVKQRRRAALLSPDGHIAQRPSVTKKVLDSLKQRGYRIAATSPRPGRDCVPEAIDLNEGPLAVVFGSEKHGISEHVRQSADLFIRIPMVGFVESFNISASAAIILHILTQRLRAADIAWRLEKADAEEIYYRWVRSSVKHADAIVERFLETGNS